MTLTINGTGGRSYEFTLYALPQNLGPGAGCYVFARYDESRNFYTFIYIGETGDLSERFDNHHKKDCIEVQGATHIAVFRTSNKGSAKVIQDDLLSFYGSPICNG